MKAVVIYNSETGFTEKYAKWISEELGCEAIAFSNAKNKEYSSFDIILFGSWCHAGSIREIDWFKVLMNNNPKKKYVVFAVGASPSENPQIEPTLERNIPEEYEKMCKAFYCPGGLNYGKMSFKHRMMMKMFAKMMAGKKDKTKDEEIMAEMIGKDYDITDRKYIQPIIEYLKCE